MRSRCIKCGGLIRHGTMCVLCESDQIERRSETRRAVSKLEESVKGLQAIGWTRADFVKALAALLEET